MAAIDRAGVGELARATYRRVSPEMRRVVHEDAMTEALIAHQLRKGDNAVDVGAHDGTILEHILRAAPDGHHVAVEPLPEKATSLAERFPGVEVHGVAVSDEKSTAQFTRAVHDPQRSGLRNRSSSAGELTEHFEVEVRTIDDLLDPERSVALIKVDVEGAEFHALKGASRTIRRWQPTLVFEHTAGGSEHFGIGPGDVFDLVSGEFGYRIFDIDGHGPYSRDAFVAVFPERMWLFVAHP